MMLLLNANMSTVQSEDEGIEMVVAEGFSHCGDWCNVCML